MFFEEDTSFQSTYMSPSALYRPETYSGKYQVSLENRTIRHKPTAISTSSNNPLGQPYNVQFNVAISAQQLIAKQNKVSLDEIILGFAIKDGSLDLKIN